MNEEEDVGEAVCDNAFDEYDNLKILSVKKEEFGKGNEKKKKRLSVCSNNYEDVMNKRQRRCDFFNLSRRPIINQQNFLQNVSEKKKLTNISNASTQASSSDSDLNVKSNFSFEKNKKINFLNELPIWRKHEEIVDSVIHNQVTVVIGDPGCGKTTQLPQILYTYLSDKNLCQRIKSKKNQTKNKFALNALSHCRLAITQPRRIAAIRAAQRTLEELKQKKNDFESLKHVPETDMVLGGFVGYSIRFNQKYTKSTRIKFMTDGCLLREAMFNSQLIHYNIIILDEAHERTTRTDLLLGLIKILLQKKPFLRVVVMSATLDHSSFISYFSQGRPIFISGRQYPVRTYYSTTSQTDYIEAVINAILQVHVVKQQDGDILVFLPGQEEINQVRVALEKKSEILNQLLNDAKNLQIITRRLATLKKSKSWKEFMNPGNWETLSPTSELKKVLNAFDASQVHLTKKISETLSSHLSVETKKKKIFFFCFKKIACDYVTSNPQKKHSSLLDDNALCSSSVLLDIKVEDIFDQTLKFKKLKVLPLYANLSINEQKKVFEPTNANTRKVILATNIAETSLTIPKIRFVIDSGKYKTKHWRYTSNVDSFTVQLITKTMANQRAGRAGREADGEVYRLYTEAEFLELDPVPIPEILRSNLTQVVLELKMLGISDIKSFPFISPPTSDSIRIAINMLQKINALDENENLTPWGKKIAALPISPQSAYFLLNSVSLGCLAEALTLVALLHADPVWEDRVNEKVTMTRKNLVSPYGDHLTLINAFNSWDAVSKESKRRFCLSAGLNHRNLLQAKRIRNQIKNIMLSKTIGVQTVSSCLQQYAGESTIRYALVKSFPYSIAKYAGNNKEDITGTYASYVVEGTRLPVSVHPSSCLFRKEKKPPFVLFSELVHTTKLYMRVVCAVEPDWLTQLHPSLFGKTQTSTIVTPSVNPVGTKNNNKKHSPIFSTSFQKFLKLKA